MKFTFDGYVLDADSRELRRGGVALTLSPKAFQLLLALLESRPKALSKAALMGLLWPDTAVVESNLSNLVGEIRAVLGEDAREPRFIRTVHRFGYAFRGQPNAEPREPSKQPLLRLKWAGGSAQLAEGDQLVGRDPDLPVCLASASVSRRHALVRVSAEKVTIEDLGSKNGTTVNGRRISSAQPLEDGDEIVTGSVLLKVRVLPPGGTTETAASRSGRRSDGR